MTRIDRRGFIRTTGVTAGAATLSISTAAAGHAAGRGAGRGARTGIEVLHADDYRLVQGERVGLISNPTGTVPDLRHEIDLMVESGQVDLVAAFGPEHGFRGSAQAGGSEGDYRDPRSAWLRQSEIAAEGAVLVRPDRFVAWRSLRAVADPHGELARALVQVLGR